MGTDEAMSELNRVLREAMGYSGKSKGTSYWYSVGWVGNKTFCYTKRRTHYKGKFGFWSWVETHFKNGKVKRRQFAKSGSMMKAEKRAEKLLKKERMKNGE